jgi:hypothetical protein
MKRFLQNLFGKTIRPAARTPMPWSVRLSIESLENRLVPTGLSYGGGPLLTAVEATPVYYGPTWASQSANQAMETSLNDFVGRLVKSPYIDQLQEYAGNGQFIGRGSCGASGQVTGNWNPSQTTINGTVYTTITDAQITGMLNDQIANRTLPAPDGNRLYIVFVDPAAQVIADFNSARHPGLADSVRDFSGYHHFGTDQAGNRYAYAIVMPGNQGAGTANGLAGLQYTTITISHEIAESITDPDLVTGWIDRDTHSVTRGSEIGDIPQHLPPASGDASGQFLAGSGFAGYRVQQEWSNFLHASVVAPADTVKWQSIAFPSGHFAVALTASNQLEMSSDGTWRTIDTNVADIALARVGSSQSIVARYTDDKLRAWTDVGTWVSIDPVNDVAGMAVDFSGSLYILSSQNHGVWRYNGSGQSWTNVDPVNDVQSIAVDRSGALYALSFQNHGVWHYDGGQSWDNIDATNDVQSMAVDNNGALYVLSFANHGVWRHDFGQSWTNVEPFDDVQNMAVDSAGELYVLSFANHDVWRYNDSQGWSNVDPVNDVQSMAVANSGSLYVLSFANHGIWQYGGGQNWTNVDPVDDVQSMAVDNTGTLYVLSFANHGIWQYGGGQNWTNVNPVDDAQSMAVDNTGALYVLSFTNHGVWQYGPQGWTNVDPVNDVQTLAVDNWGSLYALSFDNHGVWRHNRGQSWTNVRTANDAVSMAVDKMGTLFVLSSASHGILRYNGGQSWTNMRPANDIASMGVDNTGTLYALSFANRGVFRHNVGQSWTNVRTANDVATMLIDNTGTLYVLSSATHSVYRYQPGHGWVRVYTRVGGIELDRTGTLVIIGQ